MLGSLEDAQAEAVVDLSDEPVLGPPERICGRAAPSRWGSATLGRTSGSTRRARAVREGAVAGGDRNREADREDGRDEACSRGSSRARPDVRRRRRWAAAGPPSRRSSRRRPRSRGCSRLSRAGRHAASDYLEDGRGRRRADDRVPARGGGLAGQSSPRTCAGRGLVEERGPELAIFDGSGAAIRPLRSTGGSSSSARPPTTRPPISTPIACCLRPRADIVGGGDAGPIRE